MFGACGYAPTAHAADPPPRNELLAGGPLIQIPGPNPILTPGPKGTWDGEVIETSDALKDFGTYHLYYHGNGGLGYQLGLATASHPLGPFTRHGTEPILRRGPEGSWDDLHVACAMILKEGTDTYRMWYSGMGGAEEHRQWSIGLATADNPLGPWKKHPKNPILEDFGYVGGVVKVDGRYRLYTAHPIGSTGPDYSPMALATARQPEGPWTRYEGNPVLRQGEWGEWDDGGFSEAEVLYHSGVYHMFYGGAKLYRPRIVTRESIGYAYSFDGIHFTKYGRNPVATREAEPNAAAYAEVHSIIEPPFIYLYHTLRYKRPWRERFEGQFPTVEDLGVQVLIMQRPFSLDVPILSRPTLAAGTTTSLSAGDCPAVRGEKGDRSNLCEAPSGPFRQIGPVPFFTPALALGHVTRASLTVECTFSKRAKRGILLRVRSSPDGSKYDTVDLRTLVLRFRPGETCRQTFPLETDVRFVKVLVENLDEAEAVTDVKLTASLGG